jgi:hypothetical protein
MRAADLGRRLRRLMRTTATVLSVVVAFGVASLTAIAITDDPAPLVISFGALAVSALQFWRVELRGPDITVLVMESASVDILKPSEYGGEHYLLTVRQPIVIENVGGRPCVLAKFRIPGDLIKLSGWGDEHLVIEGGLGGPWDRPQPVVLDPRTPRLFTAAWTLKVLKDPVDGKPLDLRRRVSRSGIGVPVRHADLAYSETGSTVEKDVRINMNVSAIREAVEQLVVVSEGGEASTTIHTRDPINIDFQDVPGMPPDADDV